MRRASYPPKKEKTRDLWRVAFEAFPFVFFGFARSAPEQTAAEGALRSRAFAARSTVGCAFSSSSVVSLSI